jgi:hypothetical protein
MADMSYSGAQSTVLDGDAVDQMPGKVGPYLSRVNDAMKWRRDAKFDDKWSKIIKIYANQYDYPELSGYDDIIAPNMLFSTANVIVPSIMVNYPKITVTARKPDDQGAARVVEAMANYNWEHYDFQQEVRMVTKDFVTLGHGIAKVTWIFREEERELERDEWVGQVQQALLEVEEAKFEAEQAGVDVQFPSDDEVVASVSTKQMVVVEDHAHVERVSPFDVYIDPDATRLKDARWVAQRIYMPLSEAKNKEGWSAAARKRLKGTAMSDAKKDYDLMFTGEERGRDATFAIIWEYYDMVNGKMCVFAEGCDMFLAAPEDFPYPFGHPFVFAMNYIVPEKLYPIGDLEAILPLQMELAFTRTQMVNDRKRFRRMYMYKPEMLGPDGLAALLSSDDNAMIPIDTDGTFGDALAPIATTPLPPEFYNQTAMILDDINMVSGVTEYQRGQVAEVRRTATEAAMIQDMSNARSSDKLAIIEKMISDIAQRCVQLAQEFLTTDQVAKVTGPNGAVEWMPYTREEVRGEFDFHVEAGSTQPMNDTFRRQSAMQLLDVMAPFISAGVVDPAKLAQHVMREGFGIKDTEQFMLQQQPPMGGPEGPGGLPPGGMPPQDVGGGMLPEQVLEEPPMVEMDGRMGGMAPPMMPG